MVVLVQGGGPTQVLAFPPQQFLDDPKYSSDEDLPSKLEAFKSEGTAVGVEKGVRRVGFLQEERGQKKQSQFFKIILSIYYLYLFWRSWVFIAQEAFLQFRGAGASLWLCCMDFSF